MYNIDTLKQLLQVGENSLSIIDEYNRTGTIDFEEAIKSTKTKWIELSDTFKFTD